MPYDSKTPVITSVQTPRLPAVAIKVMALLVFLTAIPARAAGDETTQPVSIYCATYAAGLKTVFVKSGADGYQEISLSTANVVEAREVLVEDGRILLYGPAGEEGKHPVVASAETGGILQPLIVLNPAAEGGELAYASVAVETEPAKFPLGSFNLVNLSPNPVRISHEEEMIELESAGRRIYAPDHSAGENVAVRMDYKNGDNWLLLSSARWPSRDDRRTLVCFQLDPSSKRMIVKSVPLRMNSSH